MVESWIGLVVSDRGWEEPLGNTTGVDDEIYILDDIIGLVVTNGLPYEVDDNTDPITDVCSTGVPGVSDDDIRPEDGWREGVIVSMGCEYALVTEGLWRVSELGKVCKVGSIDESMDGWKLAGSELAKGVVT